MLYVIRHGQTDWNKIHKLQGRSDVPLNETGRAMAEEARVKYADVHFDICYCSPLIRAMETAEILLRGRDIPITTDDRLMEMCFGNFEGMVEIFRSPECPLRPLFLDPEKYTEGIDGAESFEDLFARTGAFLKEKVYPDLEAGKDVVIVGHGAMNSSIICQVKNLPIKDFWSAGIENCELKRLI